MTPERQVNISDIARAAGVSSTTVSRVLNATQGEIRISEKTRQHVLEVATRMGYQRNPFATALRTSRTGIVGAMNPNMSGTYMSILGHHLQVAAQSLGIELLIGAPQTDDESIAGQLSILQSQIFDGVLFWGDVSNYQMLLNREARFSKPHVYVVPGSGVVRPLVGTDNTAGVNLALDHLTALGHTRIAFIGNPAWLFDRERMEAYKQYLCDKNLPSSESYLADLGNVLYTPEDFSSWKRIRDIAGSYAQRLMEHQDERPTAIVCASDGYAADTLKALYRLGLRVPEDVSVVGYGDQHEATITYPELTTVRIPNQEIAEIALKLLVELIEQPDSQQLLQTRILTSPDLVVRQSTGSPRAD
jgi:DNA-binding LacI/PurR family transcriptional regulator